MQRFFHDELRQLRDDLILMGERSLDMTRLVLRAVENGDDSLALQVRGMDDRVDELEKRVDREIMRYLTLFGPMGSDVRLLLAARDIGHDLERIADEASVIAKRAMVISERGPLKDLLHVPAEGIIACEVLRLAIDSFIEGDLAKARLVLMPSAGTWRRSLSGPRSEMTMARLAMTEASSAIRSRSWPISRAARSRRTSLPIGPKSVR